MAKSTKPPQKETVRPTRPRGATYGRGPNDTIPTAETARRGGRATQPTAPRMPAANAAEAPRPQAGNPGQDRGGATVGERVDALNGGLLEETYRLEQPIAEGGTGCVYAATHLARGEPRAIKIMHPTLARNARAVARFQAEMQTSQSIGTNHVVRYYGGGFAKDLGGLPYAVMELLQGQDAEGLLEQQGALSPSQVLHVLGQTAIALDAAHAKNIVHRDLKPANLFLCDASPEPIVKVLDFGVAKVDRQGPPLSMVGSLFGTAWYMSPEQARGMGTHAGPEADRFSLGLVAHRLLTGAHYWRSTGLAELIGEIQQGASEPPSRRSPHVGPAFDDWFARACHKEPGGRFHGTTEQVDALATALRVEGRLPSAFISVRPSTER